MPKPHIIFSSKSLSSKSPLPPPSVCAEYYNNTWDGRSHSIHSSPQPPQHFLFYHSVLLTSLLQQKRCQLFITLKLFRCFQRFHKDPPISQRQDCHYWSVVQPTHLSLRSLRDENLITSFYLRPSIIQTAAWPPVRQHLHVSAGWFLLHRDLCPRLWNNWPKSDLWHL